VMTLFLINRNESKTNSHDLSSFESVLFDTMKYDEILGKGEPNEMIKGNMEVTEVYQEWSKTWTTFPKYGRHVQVSSDPENTGHDAKEG
ncbi:hypothetical protein HAX54_000972, partial [Datura stramonium]|nr:hypothetical protein [Datura stramonium]